MVVLNHFGDLWGGNLVCKFCDVSTVNVSILDLLARLVLHGMSMHK